MIDMLTIICTKDDTRVVVDNWEEWGSAPGTWLNIRKDNASISTVLTRAETQQLIAGLQAALDAEVAA